MEGNRLTGSLPDELFGLTQLTSLLLSNNTQLTGDLDNNNDRISRLSNLREFKASFTQLQGTLPDSMFSSWTNLETLNVEHASLRGILSEDIALWNASLVTLQLQNNQFSGVLPTGLDALTVLKELQLEGNAFSGTISQSLCARRGDGFGQLSVLTVDCSVECSCCDFYEETCG